MDPTSFLQGRSRETTIRRDALGRWFDDGEPLEHPNLLRAFDGWVDRAEDGRYCLRNGVNWAYFTLEGPPFFVRWASVDEAAESVRLRLSDDQLERLDPETLRQGEDGALYCDVRDGTMAACFERHAMQQLEALLREDDQGVYLALGGKRVRPPQVRDPLVLSRQKDNTP
jgi:uncharacterized protein